MRLLTFTHNNQTRIGALRDDMIVDLNAADSSIPAEMVALLEGGDSMMEKAKSVASSADATIALADVKLESPILVPPKILAVGLNYLAHFDEIPQEIKDARGLKLPEVPWIFNKQNTSANGPYDPVDLPPESPQLDYEAELGVVIGKTCRRVSKEDYLDVIAGYTILNDFTIRDWQRATPTMTMGKSWDSHCPMGPVLVTKDELPNAEELDVSLTVDGVEKQSFNTRDMLFDVATVVSHLSTAFTLCPGDVIASGTSAGVILFREGQPWLEEGQVVRVEMESIGHLENVVAKNGDSFIR
ncbi:MAG: fumarylacetoacetate hydrolase family protein [Pseudomonadota bacterium]